jgi:hypothetical protein
VTKKKKVFFNFRQFAAEPTVRPKPWAEPGFDKPFPRGHSETPNQSGSVVSVVVVVVDSDVEK